jgi:hypothetical protein
MKISAKKIFEILDFFGKKDSVRHGNRIPLDTYGAKP